MKSKGIYYSVMVLSVLSLFLVEPLIFGPKPSFAKEEVVVCTFGGAAGDAYRKAFYIPFEKETGIKVTEASPPSTAKIKAMVQSGNVEWDVVIGDFQWVLLLSKENMLEKLDYNLVDKKTLNQLDKGVVHPYGVGIQYWGVTICYNTKVFSKNPPRSWKDVWDVKTFPGPRVLKGSGSGIIPHLESAVMADGVPLEKVYPIDIDRAFKSYDRIKPYVVKWWTTGALPAQMLTDNEAVIVDTYSGRIDPIRRAGAPVAIEWNQGLLLTDYWLIPKGTKNFKNAMNFIGFSLRADRQADYASTIPYGPVNLEALNLVNPEQLKLLPSYSENKKRMLKNNAEWWADHREEVIERWNAWTLGK